MNVVGRSDAGPHGPRAEGSGLHRRARALARLATRAVPVALCLASIALCLTQVGCGELLVGLIPKPSVCVRAEVQEPYTACTDDILACTADAEFESDVEAKLSLALECLEIKAECDESLVVNLTDCLEEEGL